MKKRLFFVFCIGSMAFAALEPCFSQEITVTNVTFTMRDSDVVVHYDLNGPTDDPYKVEMVLRRESQPFFKMLPKDITCDAGTGAFSGKNREIVWHLYEDVPFGLDGDDYYFEVNATLLAAKKGGTSWLYYVGGAIIGGAALYFGPDLLKKTGGETQLPLPPSRPQ